MPERPAPAIGTLTVIGTGLIGGSFAAALKRARAVRRVIGVGRSRRNLAEALKRGLVDEASQNPAAAVADADLVLLATPVGQMGEVMRRIAPRLAPKAVVTDGGSTKRDVIECARRYLGDALPRFVPGHPIAGTEKSGAGAAFAELFRDRNVVLTPLPETSPAAIRTVRRAWQACGARVTQLDPHEHDAILAAVSHLPHVVAYALVNMLARRPDPGRLFGLSAGGLRDTVRIAGSSSEMWADICAANRDALLAAMDDYRGALEEIRAAVAAADVPRLRALFEKARSTRERWLVRRR